LLKRLGILDAVRRKALFCVDGIVVVDKVLAGEAELASTFLSEIVPRPGMKSAGPLPGEMRHGMSYAAGISAGAANREEARRFIDLLSSSGPEFLASRGFEPV
jgi:ABC-type molybdate transport system substrate-binding protein